MSDEAFPLTPLDVRTQEFTRSLRGYDCAQVDEFLRGISEALERLLRDPSTGFLIVTSPEHEAAREAEFLHTELAREEMGFAGLIVNRSHNLGLDGHSAEQVAAAAERAIHHGTAQRERELQA